MKDINVELIAELRSILSIFMNSPESHKYLEEQHMIVEAIGILVVAKYNREKAVTTPEGAIVSLHDVDRYTKIMTYIHDVYARDFVTRK